MILSADSQWDDDCKDKGDEEIQAFPLLGLSRICPKLYVDIRKFVFYTVMALSTSLVPPQQRTKIGVIYFDNEAPLPQGAPLHQLDPCSPWVLHMREKAGEILQNTAFTMKPRQGVQNVAWNFIEAIFKTDSPFSGKGVEALRTFLERIRDGVMCVLQVSEEFMHKSKIAAMMLDIVSKYRKQLPPPRWEGNIVSKIKEWLLFGPIPSDSMDDDIEYLSNLDDEPQCERVLGGYILKLLQEQMRLTSFPPSVYDNSSTRLSNVRPSIL